MEKNVVYNYIPPVHSRSDMSSHQCIEQHSTKRHNNTTRLDSTPLGTSTLHRNIRSNTYPFTHRQSSCPPHWWNFDTVYMWQSRTIATPQPLLSVHCHLHHNHSTYATLPLRSIPLTSFSYAAPPLHSTHALLRCSCTGTAIV